MTWKNVNGTQEQKPQEFEREKNIVWIRKNITKTVMESGETEVECWNYDECRMTSDEYEKYLKVIQSVEINILLDRLSIQDKSQEEMLIQQANALVNQEYTICLLESQVAQSV